MNRSSLLVFLLVLLFASILVLLSVTGREGTNPAEQTLATGLVASRHTFPAEPEIEAHAFLVKVMEREPALLKRRDRKPLPPASLTKLLTAVVVKEYLSDSQIIAISKTAKTVGEKVSRAKEGERFRLEAALILALSSSANDAAMALAEEVGKRLGGITPAEQLELFLQTMNIKARALGMDDSRFANPTGLDVKNHRSSARDLARLAEYIWRAHRDLWDLTRQTELEVISLAGVAYTAVNTNDLLKEFPAILGGKTGFTDEAKGTLILLYPLKTGETAVIVILGSEDRFEDGRKIIHWLESVPN